MTTRRKRQPAGTPTGGRFAADRRPEATSELFSEDLSGSTIETVLVDPQWRSCDFCGTSIKNVVLISTAAGARFNVGTDCAERVGIDPTEHWQRFRASQQTGHRPRTTRPLTRAETDLLDQYVENCRKLGCLAPLSTVEQVARDIETGSYVSDHRIDRALETAAEPPKPVRATEYLYLTDTDGNLLRAKSISTQYGLLWGGLDDEDGVVKWLPFQPKRESTLASKGYREAVGICADDHRQWTASQEPPGELPDGFDLETSLSGPVVPS